jgi:hypothetical protein
MNRSPDQRWANRPGFFNHFSLKQNLKCPVSAPRGWSYPCEKWPFLFRGLSSSLCVCQHSYMVSPWNTTRLSNTMMSVNRSVLRYGFDNHGGDVI